MFVGKHTHFLCCCDRRDAVDSLRVVLTHVRADEGEESAQDSYRAVNRLSSPVLRLLRGVQVYVNKVLAHEDQSGGVLCASTTHFVLPVVTAVLSLHSVIPGSEMAFFLLDT